MMTDPNAALQSVLELIERRLSLLDRAQLFLYLTDDDRTRKREPSSIELERAQLEGRLHTAIHRWKGTWEGQERNEESDRPSQSNIVVNIENQPPAAVKSALSSFPFGSAKLRRVVLLIALIVSGTIVGVIWALKMLSVIK